MIITPLFSKNQFSSSTRESVTDLSAAGSVFFTTLLLFASPLAPSTLRRGPRPLPVGLHCQGKKVPIRFGIKDFHPLA